MPKRPCLLTFLLIGIAATAHAGAPAVVVVSAHDDPSLAGSLQERLEARVGVAPEIRLRPATEVASVYARSPVSDASAPPIDSILDAVRDAYWDGRMSVAEARLEEAAALLAKSGSVTAFDPARISMWRTALLAKKDEILAEIEARKLLKVAPDFQVDLELFPPSLSKLLERVRASEPRPVTVVLSGLPRGASAWIDGRPALQQRLVVPGSHRLHIEGPGFRSIDRSFQATGDVTLPAGLAPALPPELMSILVSFALGKEPSDKERTEMWELLFRTKADAIAVVARTDGGLRARVFRGASWSMPSGTVALTSEGEKSLGDWIVASIAQGPTKQASLESAARASSDYVTFHAGVAAVARSWRVDSANGGRFVAHFAGGGPSMTARARWKSVIGDGRVVFVDFGSQKRSFDAGDGSQARAGGGSTASIRLDSGYRFALSRKEVPPSVTAFAGGAFERHVAGPLRDSTGDLRLLPSWERYSLELGLRGEVPVVVSAKVRPAVLRLLASGSPWGDSRTTPKDALGAPRAFTALSWGAAIDVDLPHRWALALEYLGSASRTSFDGVGSAPVDPQIRRATAFERNDTLQLSLGMEF